ncbi:hypothetical protein M3Y97_00879500 [Aphelenchoides bicaudatus]|nr:hypothetical protein M3Y97_00879500 [Aphelenchoides bicaudatus]
MYLKYVGKPRVRRALDSSSGIWLLVCLVKIPQFLFVFYVNFLYSLQSLIPMISITAAAHSSRRTSRPIGTHFKTFGSGRVALGSIEEDSDTFEPNRYFTHKLLISESESKFIISIRKFFGKFLHLFLRFINAFCPLLSLLINVRGWTKPVITQKKTKRIAYKSTVDRLEDKALLNIFRFCDAKTIIKLEASCSRFKLLIGKHCNELPKIQKDQIKLHFDEGEVIIFPIDERKVPARHAMPSIEHLGKYLRHISCLSLFIRGLIPVETIPVLKRLSRYRLSASQIYFLWCEFDMYASEQLKELFLSNLQTLSDIGFEVCSPTDMVSDDLIECNLPKLVSLRVWHESITNIYAISDQTLFKLADLFKTKRGCPLETLDIAGGIFTVSGVCALIEAWYSQEKPKNDIYISLHRSNFTQNDVFQQAYNIPLNFKRGLEKGGRRLTLNIT